MTELGNGIIAKVEKEGIEISFSNGSLVRFNNEGKILFYTEGEKEPTQKEKDEFIITFTLIGENEREQIQKALDEGYFKDKNLGIENGKMFGDEEWIRKALSLDYDFLYRIVEPFEKKEIKEKARKLFPELGMDDYDDWSLYEGILVIAYNAIINKNEIQMSDLESTLLIMCKMKLE